MKPSQGSAIVYIVLLVFLMMTSAAIVLSTILSKHIRASENYVSTERSFAAANSSIEEMLYQISKGGATETVDNAGNIEYGSGIKVEYEGKGCVEDPTGKKIPHLTASGIYKGTVRRITIGGGGQCPEI
ncbi:MAG: hypothetical protein AAB649_01725 [Patescibacteria group bacterium]